MFLYTVISLASHAITIKLDRLERNANGGLWEVIDVQTDTFALTVPQNEQPRTSPVKVAGHGGGGTVGTISVLDHLYSEGGQSNAWRAGATSAVSFSKAIPYTLSFHGGTQEGVVAMTIANAADHTVIGMVLVKVLLNA